ncbi:FecR family protein [Steroidobacter sp.]|uniref:FecR family protein n=1 Tax=Steroidobacter sp. TaxID=1978227 RepID=UPI001A481AFB|nr:FecR family protein [Steroidobacter sp.]MBL8265102.1 FecR family protein [Steroidobacter sp.]
MSGMDPTTRSPVAAEAAEWLTTMQSEHVTAQQRTQFAEWLSRSAEHVHVYLELSVLWRDLGAGKRSQSELDELIAAAKEDAASGAVVALEGAISRPVISARPSRMRPWHAGLAASVLIVALAALFWHVMLPRWQGESYQTVVGEQTSFTLSDGSVVRLNTRSKLRARVTAISREVELLSGEALFEVARDPERPFRVVAGATSVQAIGTVFNVYRQPEQVTVTVIEGKVRVASDTAKAEVFVMQEQAKVSGSGAIARTQQVNLQQVTAWKDRRLVFEGASLESIAAEFNRYNRKQLSIEDPDLARIRINAVFNATDPGSFVDFLQRTEGVSVRHENEIDVLHR